ncbi:hypothetical protein M2137_002979 [Parabacteroides sp. PFB2-10]|uniref:FimB/Mfa2 family fimbrial subunit n=1 Tax=Parabacteroides sp. PFB2-10 TaxID=1742405 RepID=UPI002473168C|nr:FimB/Mfa2 family fimbrial subunit [Parabacteroides sp. PFB2-10]MDH6314185.1 hypothetical protein [Parabacteroides sp. PFB2-10]
MKTHVCWVLALLACMGCNRSEPVDPIDESLSDVTFSVALSQETIPFPDTKGIPPLDIPDPVVEREEGEKTLKDQCCTIEYIVYEENEAEPVRKICYSAQEDLDFGIISDALPQGVYTILFIAHNGPGGTLSGSEMGFEKVSDTFYLSMELEVEAGQEYHQTITLHRIVSRIEFVSTDAVPEEAVSFTMDVTRYPNQLDIRTGQGIVANNDPVSFTHQFTEEQIGTTGITHAFYTFVPEEMATMDVTLTAHAEAEVLRSREVNGITPLTNRIIRYTGRLYSHSPSDDEFIISINDEWDGTDENPLPEE